ncbi:HGxxPAAW family protein [Jannaschia sp. R86511]|uniref:HGxxPAAW family protein n=1 Tax=Jannaschia sp. R86511 TaxID=3093853 RepID=UPI0036D3A6C3
MPQDPTPAPGPRPGTGAEPQEVHGGHGTSVAAWTATIGVSVGAFLVCLAMIFMWVPVIVVGSVVIVLAAVSGPVLVRAGYGEHVPNREFTGGPRAVR